MPVDGQIIPIMDERDSPAPRPQVREESLLLFLPPFEKEDREGFVFSEADRRSP